MIRVCLGLLGIVIVAGCGAGRPSAVPLQADRAELAAIAGNWDGSYDSPATGRSGSIQFKIREGVDTAYGDVVMVPRHVVTTDPSRAATEPAVVMHDAPRPLTIRFVRVAEGHVSGAIAPYLDPDCQCQVSTTFDGTVKGDRIEGTYRTTAPGIQTTGRWQVRRSASP